MQAQESLHLSLCSGDGNGLRNTESAVLKQCESFLIPQSSALPTYEELYMIISNVVVAVLIYRLVLMTVQSYNNTANTVLLRRFR